MNPLIFASTSPYKQQQLSSLGLKYQAVDSKVNEFHDSSIAADSLALRLAKEKALNVISENEQSWVLGSDQVAITHSGVLLTKPYTFDNAIKQLQHCSGQATSFFSAIWLTNGKQHYKQCVETRVHFRDLTIEEIQRYVEIDQPLDCAGSFKAESLGISLFEKVNSDDPSALIGLPLIATCNLLRKAGYALP